MSYPGWILSACLLLNAALPSAASGSGDLPQAGILGLRTVDLDGQVHRLGAAEGNRPLALVFMDTTCPISNRYVPRLNELAAAAREAGVDFYGVLSDPTLGVAEARTHHEEYALEFPVLFDSAGDLAAKLAPTHVPEAFVVNCDGRVLYRGRVDDQFESPTVLRQIVSSHDLLESIQAAGKGETREPSRTEPVGCVFEAWDAGRAQGEITYNRDVAPILAANCVECHRKGDIAPFPLENYAQARRRARTIAITCKQRIMPPWNAKHGVGDFRDERSLTRAQIAVLEAWAKAGAPEGDAQDLLPAPIISTVRWRLGEPDLVVQMPEAYAVPASGDDIYRYFVIPSELTEDKAIVAVDFRPGDPSVVHHCIVYMDRTGVAKRIDDANESTGFSVFGEHADPNGERFQPNGLDTSSQIAAWAPGTQPYVLPPGMGSHLAAGGDFVIEVHYHLTGKATTDRTAMALYFADEPVEHETIGMVMGTQNINIAPGDADYWRQVWMEVPADMDVIEISPHMHYLGKTVEVVATLPDGTEQPLITIDDWDFRWQGAYFYRQPVYLPKGTRIDAYFRFDNSAENPFNQASPPIRVKEGWRTTDEMCLFYFTVVPREAKDADKLMRATIQSFRRSGAPD